MNDEFICQLTYFIEGALVVKVIVKRSLPVLILLGIIAVCLIEQVQQTIFPQSMGRYIYFLTLTIFIVLLVISYAFNQLKMFFLGCHVLLLFFMHHGSGFLSSLSTNDWFIIFYYINFIILFFMRNGAIRSTQGKWFTALIILQALIIYYIEDGQIPWEEWLPNLPWLLSVSSMSMSLSTLLFIGAISVMLIGTLVRYSFAKTVVLGVLFCTFMIDVYLQMDQNVEWIFLGSGFLLLVSVLFESYSLAYVDELTKIPTRRKLMEDGMKLGGKYVVAMLDVDFFKKFNDRYGHDAGDEVLKMVAGCLEKVKGGGKAYRYGGEEFTILFPKKRLEDTLAHLENLREKVSKQTYHYKRKTKDGKTRLQKLRVTISIGVAEKNSERKTLEDVMKAADQALYRAKKKGRNRVSR